MPWPCATTAFAAKSLPLRCVTTAFATKILPLRQKYCLCHALPLPSRQKHCRCVASPLHLPCEFSLPLFFAFPCAGTVQPEDIPVLRSAGGGVTRLIAGNGEWTTMRCPRPGWGSPFQKRRPSDPTALQVRRRWAIGLTFRLKTPPSPCAPAAFVRCPHRLCPVPSPPPQLRHRLCGVPPPQIIDCELPGPAGTVRLAPSSPLIFLLSSSHLTCHLPLLSSLIAHESSFSPLIAHCSFLCSLLSSHLPPLLSLLISLFSHLTPHHISLSAGCA